MFFLNGKITGALVVPATPQQLIGDEVAERSQGLGEARMARYAMLRGPEADQPNEPSVVVKDRAS